MKRWSYLLEQTRFLEDLEDLGDITEKDMDLINHNGRVLFGTESGCYRAFGTKNFRTYDDDDDDLLTTTFTLVVRFQKNGSELFKYGNGVWCGPRIFF